MRRGAAGPGLITGAALAGATLAGAITPAAAAPAARLAATGSDELSSISCTSTHYCIAVGTARISRLGAGTSLALAWNGRGWQVLPTPGTGQAASSLAGVDCRNARQCIAVGSVGSVASGQNPLAERWNGRTWRRLPMPSHDGGLDAVACTSASRCMAVGSDRLCELAEQWNGSTWRVLSTPSPCGPPQSGGLTSVSCRSASSCEAVGNYMPDNGTRLTLAESWNGQQVGPAGHLQPGRPGQPELGVLRVGRELHGDGQRVPGRGSGPGSDRRDLERARVDSCWPRCGWPLRPAWAAWPACARPGACSVGSFTRGGSLFPQAQIWNGAIWPAVTPPSAPGTLSGLSCPAATRCLAVGAAGAMNFAALWNGARWRSVTSVPSP